MEIFFHCFHCLRIVTYILKAKHRKVRTQHTHSRFPHKSCHVRLLECKCYVFQEEFSPALINDSYVIKCSGHLAVLIFLAVSEILNMVDYTILLESLSSLGSVTVKPLGFPHTFLGILNPLQLFLCLASSAGVPSDSVLGPLLSLCLVAISSLPRASVAVYVPILQATAAGRTSFLSSGHIRSIVY